MKKENLKTIEKVWGEEIVLVNSKKYCSKLLVIDKNAESSYHYHKNKQETFYAIEGYVTLTVEGKDYMLAPFTRPKTIECGDRHKFRGDTTAVILEVSTYHDERDVYRLSESKEGKSDVSVV